MKSLYDLADLLLQDVAAACGVNAQRDRLTVASRYAKEGDAFFTTALPAFLGAFESSLALGGCASVPFPGFRKRSGFPLFLGGMLKQVFSEKGTAVRDDVSIEAIRSVRQFCGAFGKFFEVCAPKWEQASLDAFVTCEKEQEERWDNPRALARLGDVARRYFSRELHRLEHAVIWDELIPRHGPGQTADRVVGNAKFHFTEWPARLQEYFPYSYFGTIRQSPDPDVLFLEPGEERPVRVVTVPKSARKARVIAMEPVAMQYAQQSVLLAFSQVFSRGSATIDLSDQEPNRVLAQIGSSNGSYATIDLSEASDRVSLEHVRAVLKYYPALLGALEACRSTHALLPNGQKIVLRKFASMGSATCFPVESLVFAVMAIDSIERAVDRCSWRSPPEEGYRRAVRVFGDDIVVPTRFAQFVISDLVSHGMRPNPSKSFSTGNFRESCGGEFYLGEDVTIARLRRRLPRSRRDVQETLALIAFRNHLYMRGYWNTAGAIDEGLSRMGVPMPIVDETSPVVGRLSVSFGYRAERFHRDHQTPLVKGVLVVSKPPPSSASEEGALLKCLLPGRQEPFADRRHLERSGRPDRVRTKVGYGTPY